MTGKRHLHVSRRTLVLAALSVPATAIAATAPAPTTARQQDPGMVRYLDPLPWPGNWHLSGTMEGYETTLTFTGDLSPFDDAFYQTLGVGTGAAAFDSAPLQLTLTMSDATTYRAAPMIGGDAIKYLGHHLVGGPGVRFPGVRIVDPATLPGTVKHLRYPRTIRATVDLPPDGSAGQSAGHRRIVMARDLNPSPTAFVPRDHAATITYWGNATQPD